MKFIMILLFISFTLFGSVSTSTSLYVDMNVEKNIVDLEPKEDHSDYNDLDDKIALLDISLSQFQPTCKHFMKNNDTHYKDERNFLPLQPPDSPLFI